MEEQEREYELFFLNGLNIEREFSVHKSYELLFVLSGNLDLMTKQSVYHSRGSILALIPPGLYHCNMLSGDSAAYVRYVFYFSADFLAGVPEIGQLLEPFGGGEAIYELDERQKNALHEDFGRLYARPDRRHARLMLPLILYDIGQLGESVPLSPRHTKEYIADVIRFISENYRKKLVASEIAGLFGVSRTKLLTDFYSGTGFTFCNYIMRERVAHARGMLKGELSVSEIAELAGFSSDTHFRYCFHAVMGMSPSEYRKNGEQFERSLR